MPENNPKSFEDIKPEEVLWELESQFQFEESSSEDENSEDEKKEEVLEKCQLWANWFFFIVPARVRESLNKPETDESSDPENYDRFVPKTKVGRQIGVMKYILNEDGAICLEEMLLIDVVLRRISSFSPNMSGIDHYDEMVVLQMRHGLRHFVEDFFSIDPRRRQKILEDSQEAGESSPEIMHAIMRLKNLANIRKAKKRSENTLNPDKPGRFWQDGLTGRDLELFKLLSGIETMSPRSQALSVLNYILPEEDSSISYPTEPIRFESGDKERIKRLLKRYPSLKNRYPYLLKMIECDIPAEKFNAQSKNQEYFYSNFLPFSFIFPSVLADSPKESTIQKWFSNRLVQLFVMIAAVCALFRLAIILTTVMIK